MNILFMTIGRLGGIEQKGIYTDLLRRFRDKGHNIYIILPRERFTKLTTELVTTDRVNMLYVKVGNITKCNLIEKGISTVRIESQYKAAIKKYFSGVKFDLVMYSTPPITLAGAVEYVKKRDNAHTYLLLKDIFPQNSVDIGMMSKSGVKGLLYKYFRSKEKQLYALSDTIGCMSQANCDYVIKHNSDVDPKKIEVCPNSVEPVDMSVKDKSTLRKKYGIPEDKIVFVYGGNLGRPQGIPFLIACLDSQRNNEDVFFLVVGDGTEYGKLEVFVKNEKQSNVKLMSRLPKEDYDRMVGSCDVGLIFLDHRFTIPNFPSRLLAYMQAKIPVLAVTDPNTDIGKVITEGGFGWWCESNDLNKFGEMVETAANADRKDMGENAWKYLNEEYTVEKGYQIIMKHMR